MNSLKNLSTNSPSLQRSSLKDQAVSTLRKYIIAGDIPPGTQLVERDIAQLLNISRGPTREALLELENQGLVINSRNRRHVIEPSEEEVINMFEVRAPLEKRAAERAAENTNSANQNALRGKLRKMEEAVKEKDRTAFVLADLELHQMIWHQSGNVYLENVLNTMSAPIFVAIVNGSFQGFDWDETVELHRNLVESINNGDVALAGRLANKNMEDALSRNRSFS
ncbi:MAG: GntR family transcriptional regulator [Ardenticatenaceae bacterium]